MAFVVASLRGTESQRPDAIICDPFAQQLAGDISGQMQLLAGFKYVPPDMTLALGQQLLALRTRYLDDALSHCKDSIRQVVILGSGLDTRAFRLEALRDCVVVEIDASNDLLQHKRQVMQQANAQLMAKSYHTIVADLEQDNWETKLLNKSDFKPTSPTFWCMEGLLNYHSYDSIVKILKTIDSLSPHGSVFWADMGGRAATNMALIGDTTLKYGEDDPINGVLGVTHWNLSVQADLSQTGQHFGRDWMPMMIGEDNNSLMHESFVVGTKPSDEKKVASQP